MDRGYGCECSRPMIYGMLSIGWQMSYPKLNQYILREVERPVDSLSSMQFV
jgi:hypothetical protein